GIRDLIVTGVQTCALPILDGRIVEFLVREGQEVEQATPLFKVDDAQLKAQVDQLEAQRDLAQQALARTKELAKQNASSAADLEQIGRASCREGVRIRDAAG